ncbi:MAG TPA: HAMP domain-containing sensor histidine kinase [Fimbriiglobus sp.]|jgi:signal transduction histidine kinase
MSTVGGLSSGLAFLPALMAENADGTGTDSLLTAWIRANGWRAAGIVWPVDGPVRSVLLAKPDSVERVPQPPVEIGEVIKSLRSGATTVVWQVPASSGRLHTFLTPPGRQSGVVWCERAPGEPWSDAERNYLRLSARMIERCPAFGSVFGPVIESERLHQRLGDAAIIAGRMAHDFDNILTGIIGFADLTLPLLPMGSQQSRFIGEIGKVGQRGIQFTQQLHQLSRSGQIKPLPGLVSQAVQKETERIRPLMPPGVQVLANVSTSLASVAMDAGPLQTVLGHLLQNAVEATPATGPVVVTARAVELNPSDAKAFLGQAGPGAHIEVAVQDAGPGIKNEVRAKLFAEPFFTTKVRHRGLGLAVVYRVLYAHRGGIRIEPGLPPDTGTTVRIVIPLAAARPPVASPATVFSPSVGG